MPSEKLVDVLTVVESSLELSSPACFMKHELEASSVVDGPWPFSLEAACWALQPGCCHLHCRHHCLIVTVAVVVVVTAIAFIVVVVAQLIILARSVAHWTAVHIDNTAAFVVDAVCSWAGM